MTIAEKILSWATSLREILTRCNTKITEKSGTAATNFAGLPDAIDTISSGNDTSDATAVAGDILASKTAYTASGKVTGTMANRGAVAMTMDGVNTDSVTILAGYHSGAGKVTLDSTIKTKVMEQKSIIEEISTILDTKASAYPTITFDETTKTLTITEVSGS